MSQHWKLEFTCTGIAIKELEILLLVQQKVFTIIVGPMPFSIRRWVVDFFCQVLNVK